MPEHPPGPIWLNAWCGCLKKGQKTTRLENVICSPTEHQEFTRTRLKCLRIAGSNQNLEMLVFEERGKPEYPEKNLSEKNREPATNSTHIWCRVQESILGQIELVGGKRSHHCVIPAPLGFKKMNISTLPLLQLTLKFFLPWTIILVSSFLIYSVVGKWQVRIKILLVSSILIYSVVDKWQGRIKIKIWFMLSVHISSYGCTWEVWRARKKCKSCSRRNREQL